AIASCIKFGTMLGGRCTLNAPLGRLGYMVSNTASTINFYGLSQTPVPGGIIDGNGTVVFAPQGTLTGGTNDRLIYINSSYPNVYQLANNAKYTLATSPTGAT